MSYLELSDLTQEEKFIIWRIRNAIKYREIQKQIGLTPARLSHLMHRGDIHPWLHKALLEKGVPLEVLPPPVQRKPGAPKKIRESCIQSCNSVENASN